MLKMLDLLPDAVFLLKRKTKAIELQSQSVRENSGNQSSSNVIKQKDLTIINSSVGGVNLDEAQMKKRDLAKSDLELVYSNKTANRVFSIKQIQNGKEVIDGEATGEGEYMKVCPTFIHAHNLK